MPFHPMVVKMHYCGTNVIERHGSEALRRSIVADGKLTTLSFSEYGSRSHFWIPISTATRDAEGIRLNASKQLTTSAGECDIYVWSSRPVAADGLSTKESEELIDMLKERLEAHDYDVITAYNGLDALSEARSKRPDLIILDVMMPKMDGYKVCAMLKFDIQYMRTPIILLTARSYDDDMRTGKQLKADAYVVNPFDGKELLALIEQLLRRSNWP